MLIVQMPGGGRTLDLKGLIEDMKDGTKGITLVSQKLEQSHCGPTSEQFKK